jgi:hypothetical protein
VTHSTASRQSSGTDQRCTPPTYMRASYSPLCRLTHMHTLCCMLTHTHARTLLHMFSTHCCTTLQHTRYNLSSFGYCISLLSFTLGAAVIASALFHYTYTTTRIATIRALYPCRKISLGTRVCCPRLNCPATLTAALLLNTGSACLCRHRNVWHS